MEEPFDGDSGDRRRDIIGFNKTASGSKNYLLKDSNERLSRILRTLQENQTCELAFLASWRERFNCWRWWRPRWPITRSSIAI